MNSKEYRGLMEAYSQVYNNEELSEAPFTWDPNKNVIAAKGPKLGIMTKGDPKSWREPSYQEKGEIPLSSTKAFEKSPAGQKFIQQRDAAKAAKLPPSTPTARPAASTPTVRPSVSQPKPAPTTSGYKKDTSITDMIGRSQIRQGAPINTGNPSSDIRAMAARSTVGATPTPSAVKPSPTPVNKATGSKKPGSVYSGFDMFDLVKGHLLDEGYANDEKSALAIMANMSESWKQSIIEAEVLAKKDGVEGVGTGSNWKAKSWTGAEKQRYSQYKSPSPSTSPKPSSSSTSSKPSSTVTARDKFHAYNDSRNRADNIASVYGVNRNDPRLKQWADTNYRQNISIKGNDPNYDPTKTSYPEFTPAKKSAKDAWKNL